MNKYNDFLNIVQSGLYENVPDAFSKEDVFRILAENDDDIKPFAIINLKSLDNENEAKTLLGFLTGQDGRIREAVSFVLGEIPNAAEFLTDSEALNTIIEGLLDINPNVVRNVISFIEKNENLKTFIAPLVVEKANAVADGLSKYIKEASPFIQNQTKSNKNHAKNKLTFNLYWLLSCISILNVNKISNLENILTKTSVFLDYTIREKTALILSKMENPPIKLLRELKNDENLYVKNQLL